MRHGQLRTHSRCVLLGVVLAATAASAQVSIRDIRVEVAGRYATISWETSPRSVGGVAYGFTTGSTPVDFSFSSPHFVTPTAFEATTFVQRHSRTLTVELGKRYHFVVWARAASGATNQSPPSFFFVPRDPNVPMSMELPNGPVNAVARLGNILYVGGAFTNVAPFLGRGYALFRSAGSSELAATDQPPIDGEVRAVTPDGRGGFFIGGRFSRVGAYRRANLAHILPDLGVDPEWDPAVDGDVNALRVLGTRLYVGGRFTEMRDRTVHPRASAGAIDVMSGAIDPVWDPSPAGEVVAIAADPSTIYLGGSFSSATSFGCSYVLGVNAASGTQEKVCGDIVLGPVTALAWLSGRLYFGRAGSVSWFDTADGGVTVLSPALTEVNALAADLDAGWVFVGGRFDTGSRANALALGRDGGVTPWNPSPRGTVRSIALDHGRIYLGGEFSIDAGLGVSVANVAATNSTGSLVQVWDAGPNGPVLALATSADVVYAGGRFTGHAGSPRKNLAAFDVAFGSLQPWSPNADGPVRAIGILDGGMVLVGGDFGMIGTASHRGVAQVSTSGAGLPTTWDPLLNGAVHAIVTEDQSACIGGEFSSVFGSARGSRVAAFDFRDGGGLLPWDATQIADAGGFVRALALGPGRIFIGGSFDAGPGGPFNFVAVGKDGGSSANFDPGLDGPVSALAWSPSATYLGGAFGTPASNLAGFVGTSLQSGLPVPEGEVRALWVDVDEALYVGGRFATVGGAWNPGGLGLRAFDQVWSPTFRGADVRAISTACVAGEQVWGGGFDGTLAVANPNLAIFSDSCRPVPTVQTRFPVQLDEASVRFEGLVSPNNNAGVLTYHFQWSTTDMDPVCGSIWGDRAPATVQPVPAGLTAPVSTEVNALDAGLQYYVCLVATLNGSPIYGGVLPFMLQTLDGGTDAGDAGDDGGTDAGTDGGADAGSTCTSFCLVLPPPDPAVCAREWTYRPSTEGGSTTPTWSTRDAPRTLTVDPSTGELKWTPTPADKGTRTFTLTATAGPGVTASETVSVSVSCQENLGFQSCGCTSASGAVAWAAALLLLRRRRQAGAHQPDERR